MNNEYLPSNEEFEYNGLPLTIIEFFSKMLLSEQQSDNGNVHITIKESNPNIEQ